LTPWYYEKPGPALFNAWSFPHLVTGLLASRYVDYPVGLLGHTIYESVETDFKIARQERDTSFLNHVGDTIAFTAGFFLARRVFPSWFKPGA
jgi:hypothetical protein